MTLFAHLMIGIGLSYLGYAVVLIVRAIFRRRRRQIGPYDLIMVDQWTQERRRQHANVGHKAAKGFHAVPFVPMPEAQRRQAALFNLVFVPVPMTEAEKQFPDPDYFESRRPDGEGPVREGHDMGDASASLEPTTPLETVRASSDGSRRAGTDPLDRHPRSTQNEPTSGAGSEPADSLPTAAKGFQGKH